MNKITKNQTLKIIQNSEWPLVINNYFSFYDEEKSKQITKIGKLIIEKITKNNSLSNVAQ